MDEHPKNRRSSQVIFTNKARCRDCYRCLRACPVKAIRMHEGQAYVEADRCIACGTCIRECPQGAKTYRIDVAEVERLLALPEPVAVSIAPSFVAAWTQWERRRLPSALRQLGFRYVAETAVGAYFVAHEIARIVKEQPDRLHLCTACPATVNYIVQYAPEFAKNLTPVVSPMVAHGRHIKATRGAQWKVVFIGPCTAKKAEAQTPAFEDAIDAVITFHELLQLLEKNNIDLSQCEESAFDETPFGDARFFPMPGGLLRTANLSTDPLDTKHLAICGVEELKASLIDAAAHPGMLVIEPLFCQQGCVSGAGMPETLNAYTGRNGVLGYAKNKPGMPVPEQEIALTEDLHATFAEVSPLSIPVCTEEEIQAELLRLGKPNKEDQLNCAACGYSSCRDKAIANIVGMAEPEMCVPQMRRLAEQRSDRIIDTSPNGIVMLDEHLHILGMNPAFKRLFFCSEAVIGKPIAYLIDPAPFEKLATGESEGTEFTTRYDNYNLVCHVLLYPLREEKQYVGIFVNTTKSNADEAELRRLRSQTVAQAQELLEHQITMAQKLAQFLGESTAHGEVLVKHLIELAEKR